jgi:hypothetical protein
LPSAILAIAHLLEEFLHRRYESRNTSKIQFANSLQDKDLAYFPREDSNPHKQIQRLHWDGLVFPYSVSNYLSCKELDIF